MRTTQLIIGLILVAIGLSILFDFPFVQFLIALIIIYLGVRILTGTQSWNWSGSNASAPTQSEILNEVVVFGPLNRTINSEHFRGGRVTVVFGGGELDLRGAKLAESTTPLEVTVVFGGLKLLISPEWRITSRGNAILGSFNNTAKEGSGDLLEVSGTAILGEVSILN